MIFIKSCVSLFKQSPKNGFYLVKKPNTTAFEDQIKKCLYRRTLSYFSGNTATLQKVQTKSFQVSLKWSSKLLNNIDISRKYFFSVYNETFTLQMAFNKIINIIVKLSIEENKRIC